ncbi:NUDIX hydrolase [Defluviimonas sp. WL0050]|uniref:NUDIX hydrolase n=1 Tax=Albidovulum litorale TaxID=2984134 RepID=A0ABT2ZJU2_9RHOB|nr:NUDIX hydrolase [Defluviimonas sp. WL0050]MCV2871397.1 NUDIX hydrolase [Defluviimonas sp. WL0050]
MAETGEAPPIRDASTVLLVRRDNDAGPSILMGQRGAGAVFMPNKYVFPGGAVDRGDADIPLAAPIGPVCTERLGLDAAPGLAGALAAGAIRELWEETGLILGQSGAWPGAVPYDWQDFAGSGFVPAAAPLTFVFRAITPPGRPRRFDARFFLADATHVAGDPDDFSRASDELSHLHWVPLTEARRLNLPFITEVVLGEVSALLDRNGPPDSVPFFDNSGPVPRFRRLQ